MLNAVCHGDKLTGVGVPILWYKLHVGNTEHTSKIHTAVALSPDYKTLQLNNCGHNPCEITLKKTLIMENNTAKVYLGVIRNSHECAL